MGLLLYWSHLRVIITILVVVDVPGITVSFSGRILIGGHDKLGVTIADSEVWIWRSPHCFAEINVKTPAWAYCDLLIVVGQCGRRVYFPCSARASISDLHRPPIGARCYYFFVRLGCPSQYRSDTTAYSKTAKAAGVHRLHFYYPAYNEKVR